jgi:uncharacterized repeat protein (TIGR01451 family)
MNLLMRLGQIRRSARPRPGSKKRPRYGLAVEALEQRLVFSADLGITTSSSGRSITATGDLLFDFGVKNSGPGDASMVVFTDTLTLPAGAMIVSETSSAGSATISGNTVTANLGTLASGASATLTVGIKATMRGHYSHALDVTSPTPDPTPNNKTTSTFDLRGPDTVTLTPSTNAPRLNQPLTLTAQVRPPAGLGLPTPTGTAMFFDGTTSLGAANLDASGNASFFVPSVGLGHHVYSVSYSGDNAGGLPNYSPNGANAAVYVTDQLKYNFSGGLADDLTVYGQVSGNLYGFKSLTRASGYDPTKAIVFTNQTVGFGNAASIPVAGDYFGDGKLAYGIWSPDGHGFMILQVISSVDPTKFLSIDFGLLSDVPVVADVDGDGKADFGVFGPDPHLGYRYDFLLSTKNFDTGQALIFNNYGFGYGTPDASPVVADFDGSGHAGFGVYIPSGTGGTFTYTNVAIPQQTVSFVVNPPATVFIQRTFGFSTDKPMAADYDGDGKADLALYGQDPRTGRFRYDILTSTSNFNKDVYFDNAGLGYGFSASIPIMANYEGNGFADFGVFQPGANNVGSFIFQDVMVGHGVVYPSPAPAALLPVTAPTFLLAKKVRGQ